MTDVFISYSRRDQEFVRWLHGELKKRGRDAWVDWEDIPPGWNWKEELQAGIDASVALVFVVTPASLASEVCAHELAQALRNGKRVVPVVREEPGDAPVPPALAERNWVFFRNDAELAKGLDDLVAALETDAEWVREHTRLLVRATEWDKEGRDRSLLLHGSDLASAEAALAAWREGNEPAPTSLQHEYVAAGRRGSARRTRALLAASFVALAISVVLGVLALLERNRAIDRERAAQSRALAGEAVLQSDSNPELSVVLAVDAVRLRTTQQSEEALRRAVSQVQARGTRHVARKPVDRVSIVSPSLMLAVSDGGRRAELWDPSSGRRRAFELPPGPVSGAQLSADGRRLLLASLDGATLTSLPDGGAIRMRSPLLHFAELTRAENVVYGIEGKARIARWDARTGRRLKSGLARGNAQLFRLGADRRGRTFVAVYEDGTVRAWSARAGWLERSAHEPPNTFAVAMAPDGSFAVSVAPDAASIEVWDPRTGADRHRLRGHTEPPVAVAVSADSRLVAAGGVDNTARIWHARSGRPVHTLRGHADTVSRVAFSRDGRRVLTVSADETARVWSVRTGESLAVLRGHRGGIAWADLTADGRYVVTGGVDGTARLWEASPGRTLVALSHRGVIEDAAIDPAGDVVASAGPDRLQFADADSGRILQDDAANEAPGAKTVDIAFRDDGRRVAVADGFAVIVYATRNGDRAFFNHDSWVNDVAWMPGGREVLSASSDGTARVLDLTKRPPTRLTIRPGGPVMRALPTPDGQLIVTLGDRGGAKVWRASDGVLVHELRGGDVASANAELAISPDGGVVAMVAGNGTTARLWRPGSGPPRLLSHGQYVSTVRFSRDGRWLATASGDGTARVWDVRTGREEHVLRRHQQPVNDVDFSPDGRFLITASDDGQALVWDLRTGRVVSVFGGHDGPVREAGFSADGRKVLTVPSRGTAAVFACDACGSLDDVLTAARRLIKRRLTDAERARVLR